MDVKQPVELRFARFGQRGEFAVPCVIDQVVESGPPPDAGQRAAEAVGEGREAGGLRHIQRQGDGLAAQGADVGDHRFRLFEIAAVGDDDIPTLAGDIQCSLTAKAAVGAGKEKIGVVSASNALTLDELSDALSQKADKQGASAYKILSATGNNRLHGVAEIYK